jgi:hypothetical protein
MPTIDIHTHIVPREWEEWGARHGGTRWPRLVHERPGCATLYQGEAFFRSLTDAAFDPVRRLADMARLGIGPAAIPRPPREYARLLYFDRADLPEATRARLLGENALAFLGLSR